MANVLIASLGESPIVVTAMVKALKEKKDIEPDKVMVLYPEEHPNIKDGLDLIETHCLCGTIEPYGLPFFDANTYRRCYLFLQTVYGLLETCQNDSVWLSLAGGRKTMSALMYLFASFYETIRGVYHILDKNEGTSRKNFHILEDLLKQFCTDDPKLNDIMNPPADQLNLIEIPFGRVANPKELRRMLRGDADQPMEGGVSVNFNLLPEEAQIFWAPIFQKKSLPDFYDIAFSENAKNQFGSPQANKENFSRYFSSSKLKHPDWANRSDKKNGGRHVTFDGKDRTRFHIAKIGATAERIAWWLNPTNKQVVIAELGVEKDDGSYYRLGAGTVLNKEYFSKKGAADYQPVCNVNALIPFRKVILLAAVGKSPMVVTQAYTLLQKRENAVIDKVAVVFPEQNATVKAGIRILDEVFKKKATVIKRGVALRDINSAPACETFLERMVSVVDELKRENPDSEIRLLLSGGRKGMSALSYLAAQRSNIGKIYHTLISDSELEDQITTECRINHLNELGSTTKKAEKMFLDIYPIEKFDFFEVPIIPLQY